MSSFNMTGAIGMDGKPLQGLPSPVNQGDAISKAVTDAMNASIAGFVSNPLVSDLNASSKNITNLNTIGFDASGPDIDLNGRKFTDAANGTAATDPMTMQQGWDKINESGVVSGQTPTEGNSLYYDTAWLPGPGTAGVVTVGPYKYYDIFVDESSTDEGHVFTDAINLLMTRTSNRGGEIRIGPCKIDCTDSPQIYLNHTSAHGAPLSIIGSGVGGSTSEGTMIVSPHGIMIGEFAFGGVGRGVRLENFYLYGDPASPANIGIDCNSTQCCVELNRLLIRYFAVGVDMRDPGVYNQRFQDVDIQDCTTGGFCFYGNNNVLDHVKTGYGTTYDLTDYGIWLSGSHNIGMALDVAHANNGLVLGTAPDGGARGNIIMSCWSEPCTTERNVSIIYGQSNTIHFFGCDNTKPYGRMYVTGDHNDIDLHWDSLNSFTNITFSSSAYYNNLHMYPYHQSSSRGVVTDNSVNQLDYGNPMRTDHPFAGYWYRGAHVVNKNVAAGGSPGWYCVASGSPGTWKAEAVVAG